MQTPMDEDTLQDLLALKTKFIGKRRARVSKFPKTNPRYWLNVYNRNSTQGRPPYEGIPEAMHEPIKAIKRAQNAKHRAKKVGEKKRQKRRTKALSSASQREKLAKAAEEIVLDATEFAWGGLPASKPRAPRPTGEAVAPARPISTTMRLWPLYFLMFAMFAINILYTSVFAEASRLHLQSLERRVHHLETAVPVPHASVELP